MKSDTRRSGENSTSDDPRSREEVALATSTARSRFTPAPRAGLILGERDNQLLTDLMLHRVMTQAQIQELYFGSLQRCNDRLRRLFDWGYVSRYYLPAAPFGSQALYSLGKAGIPRATRLLASRGIELGDADIRIQCCRPVLSLLDHALAIVDVYIAFRQATARRDAIRLETWLPERLCREEYDVRRTASPQPRRWRKEVFSPDAFLRLSRYDSDAANLFLEVDLGHTNSRQFLRKLQIHRRFQESGLFTNVYGASRFFTAVITTGEHRLRNLVALADQEESDQFLFTTFGELKQDGLAAIWCRRGRPGGTDLDNVFETSS